MATAEHKGPHVLEAERDCYLLGSLPMGIVEGDEPRGGAERAKDLVVEVRAD